jgi:hypothetical protein
MTRPHLLALLLLPTLAACASRSWRFQFDPSPHQVEIQPETVAQVRARALTTVLRGEVRREDDARITELHLRLLIENLGTETVSLTTEGMRLVGSDLVGYGAPRIVPEPGTGIRPGAAGTFELYFAYPKGMQLSAPELDGLNLTWSLEYPTGVADVSQSFVRRWPARYEESGPRWSFFFSSGHYH